VGLRHIRLSKPAYKEETGDVNVKQGKWTEFIGCLETVIWAAKQYDLPSSQKTVGGAQFAQYWCKLELSSETVNRCNGLNQQRLGW
jgi:hypothetical protein